jgi:hypothetical protein
MINSRRSVSEVSRQSGVYREFESLTAHSNKKKGNT